MIRAAPIPNGIKDWLGYMQFVEPFEADTLSSTDPGVLRGDTNICIVLDRSEILADLSSILGNALYDDVELEGWNVVPIAKTSHSRTNPVLGPTLDVGNLAEENSEENLRGVFDGYQVLWLVYMKWDWIFPAYWDCMLTFMLKVVTYIYRVLG